MARGQRPFSFPPFSFFHGNQGSSRFFRIRPPPSQQSRGRRKRRALKLIAIPPTEAATEEEETVG